MDGKGRALDNVIIERYWRSYKYECIYLHSIMDGWHLKRLTEEYIHFYNSEGLRQSLQYQTPLDHYHLQPPRALYDRAFGNPDWRL
jgi:putative transposase